MDNKKIAEELIRMAKGLSSSKSDEWTESDIGYREFVEDVVPKYHGRYKNGVAEFSLLNLKVYFSSNETKFIFELGNKRWGSAYSAAQAGEIIKGLTKLRRMLD